MQTICSKCGIEPVIAVRLGGKPSETKSMCKRCRQRAYQKNYEDRLRADNKFRPMRRATKLKRVYGLTSEMFEVLWEQQQGCCQICKEAFAEPHTAYIDHCHNSSDVRGLLCNNCNLGLGYFKDSFALLRSATEYLQMHQEYGKKVISIHDLTSDILSLELEP